MTMIDFRTFARRFLGFGLALALALPALAAPSGVVNINAADADQLMLLPRVGPALAARIVAYRDENGAFEQSSDLLLVRGIGDKTFAGMKAYVAIEGETTLQEKVHPGRAASEPAEDGR